MSDPLTEEERTELMGKVRQRDTAPELVVRRALTAMGRRYRINDKTLPGSPDITFRSRKKVIFVNGCFWHAHRDCRKFRIPKNNHGFWEEKFCENILRDKKNLAELNGRGFESLVMWECELTDMEVLANRLQSFLDSTVDQDDTQNCPTLKFTKRDDSQPIERRLKTGDTVISIRRLVANGHNRPSCCSDPRDEFDQLLLRSLEKPDWNSGRTSVRVADIFAGCGGLSLGAAEACLALGIGFKPVLAMDSDPTCLTTYKNNFGPDRSDADDIRTVVNGELGKPLTRSERKLLLELRELDLLLAGPPCQGHSDLNNHTRRNDTRNDLYVRVARFAEVMRPAHILIENVPTVVHAHDRSMQTTQNYLESLGYKTDGEIVDLSSLGVPQRRKRHVLIASLEKNVDVNAVINCYRVPNTRSVAWAIRDLEKIHSTALFDSASTSNDENRRRIDWLLKNDKYDLPNRLRPVCHQDGAHSYLSMYGRLRYDQPAQTITTGFGSPGQGRYIHPSRRRTITPHEGARLQMFPDYFDFSNVERRGQLSRMIGNAVPMSLAQFFCLELLR